MDIEKILIEVNIPEEQFKKHLDLPENNKILFSGIFGIGKTYFLKKFFNDSKKYNVVHLSPVNYSIASNEDIFRLIKFDILYNLIVEKNYDIQNNFKNINEEKIDFYDIYGFVNYNFTFLLAYMLHFIPKIGKASSNFAEKTKILWDNYILKLNDKENLIKEVSDFAHNMERHYLYENDIIVTIINDALNNFKQERKDNILIIDDLDRIDPKHIFRLLNIFSANTDDNIDSKYKHFSFDRIIFVLDIKNVRNIFHSQYGSSTDFSGYIDKFYSYEVFEFDNISAIMDSLSKILNSINTPDKYKAIFNLQEDSFIKRTIELVLITLIKNNALNLRTLLKFSGKEYSISGYQIMFKNHVKHASFQIPIILVYDFLKSIFGSHDGLMRAIKRSIRNINIDKHRYNLNWFTGMLLLILDCENHRFKVNISKDKIYKYACKEYSFTFHYSVRKNYQYNAQIFGGVVEKVLNEHDEEVELEFDVFFHILHKTFEKINDLQSSIVYV